MQDGRPLDGGARPDGNALLAVGGESRPLDLQGVGARGQRGEPQLSLLVGGRRRRATDQGGGGDPDDRVRQEAALRVPDGADQGPAQSLRRGWAREQETADGENESKESAHGKGSLWTSMVVCVAGSRIIGFRPVPAKQQSIARRAMAPVPCFAVLCRPAGATIRPTLERPPNG